MARKIILWCFAFALAATPVFADSQGSATGGTAGTQSTGAGCIFQSPTLTTGQQMTLRCGSDGSLVISGTVTSTAGNAVGITPTDRTITSATGSSQTVMAANASRHSLLIQNTGTANCGVNPTGGTAVIGGAGTLTLIPQASYSPRIPTLSAVTAICTSTQPLYANEN